jgi:hypothetical protein
LQALDVALVAAAENFGQEFINHGSTFTEKGTRGTI